jgi:hypothetical protein
LSAAAERFPTGVVGDIVDAHGAGGAQRLQARAVVDVVLHAVKGLPMLSLLAPSISEARVAPTVSPQ